MTSNNDQINLLLQKLEAVLKKQTDFSTEINKLQNEILKLKYADTAHTEIRKIELESFPNFDIKTEKEVEAFQPIQKQNTNNPAQKPSTQINKLPKSKSNIEKFIGENLINKIGIAFTIIGVAIGAKYSIDHDLISPLTRIILGYLMGIGLLIFGVKLKNRYTEFSAVLVSGSIAIMYFITFSAYGIYNLIPQTLAFGLMVLLTLFAVFAAIKYNRQVIAHIGLVGAYAVPFLLSDGSGKVAILFSYMAIINLGILILSFRKYWKPLYFSAFGLTWLIFSSWYVFKYQPFEHFSLTFVFLSLFFIIFYLTFLAYKLFRNEKFEINDIILLLANSFIFYGFGYAILSSYPKGESLLGLFTLGNAIVHLVISSIIYKRKLADRNLFYLVSGLFLIFITIAIPVQLNGNWVTLLWVGEAALLFWIGRTKNVALYEKLSYPLMILALFSIVQDWTTYYSSFYSGLQDLRIKPIINIHFLTSLLFIAAFGFINIINSNKKYPAIVLPNNGLSRIMTFAIPAIFIITIYYAFRMEISNYWNQLNTDSALSINKSREDIYNENFIFQRFKILWIINYSLFFFSLLSFINIKKLISEQLGILNLGFNALTILIFLTQGLYALSELRETYLAQNLYGSSQFNLYYIGIRYASYLFVSLTLFASYKYIRQVFIKKNYITAFDLLLHVSILWIVSSELINWMDIVKSTHSYKLGLSILWGFYSLLLIAFGIWKKKTHLRVGAIVLFGATVLKLFLYDISHLDTIAKTIVFVSLGILLLIISFLYNKYKHIIEDEI